METATVQVHRRRYRDSFRVVPQEAKNETQLYAVLGPTGVALYTFTDLREAIAEASALNSARIPDGALSRLVVADGEE